MNGLDITTEFVEQIDWHWRHQLRARLEGLTDEEYLWEPVEGCWNLRHSPGAEVPNRYGSGEWKIDFQYPEPVPAPVTTIAWRLCHILVGVLGMRIASHFGGAPMDYMSFDYPGRADDALALLDDLYAQWTDGVRSWKAADLAVPVGDTEAPQYAHMSRATLVLHIHRELIHHGAEIALLRDLHLRMA